MACLATAGMRRLHGLLVHAADEGVLQLACCCHAEQSDNLQQPHKRVVRVVKVLLLITLSRETF